jgi:glutamine synthetase
MYPDPFRGGDNILVLAATYIPGPDGLGEPAKHNNWHACNELMEQSTDSAPWFGIEQEYTMFKPDGKTPLGWPENGYPGPQGPYYCSAGANVAFGRQVVEAHYRACLYCGIKISGVNAEVMPGQWEYQVGPCLGIEQGNSLWMSRYILLRVAEECNVVISFDPKPIPGDWNGAGCHTNYSTKAMREVGGMEAIKEAISKMSFVPGEHIAVYGSGNERRLTGAHETASIDTFSWGVANRGASIRVGRDVAREGKGYLEDRRPASNCDPYLVTAKVVDTTIVNTDIQKRYAEAVKTNPDYAESIEQSRQMATPPVASG